MSSANHFHVQVLRVYQRHSAQNILMRLITSSGKSYYTNMCIFGEKSFTRILLKPRKNYGGIEK